MFEVSIIITCMSVSQAWEVSVYGFHNLKSVMKAFAGLEVYVDLVTVLFIDERTHFINHLCASV